MSPQEKTTMMKTLAANWQESGMTQAEYAQTNNLSVHTLKYWLYKGKRAKTSSFVQVSDLSFGKDFVVRYPHGVELKIPSTTPTAIIRALINL